jgi:hypothetical protein
LGEFLCTSCANGRPSQLLFSSYFWYDIGFWKIQDILHTQYVVKNGMEWNGMIPKSVIGYFILEGSAWNVKDPPKFECVLPYNPQHTHTVLIKLHTRFDLVFILGSLFS